MAHEGKTWLARFGFIGALSALAFAGASHVDPGSAAAQETGPTGARSEGDDYIATLSSSGTYTAGKAGTMTLKLVPKTPFKVNKDFPIKFVLGDPPGGNVTFTKKKIEKSDGTVDEKSATFTINFTPTAAGKATVSGKFHFSVCTDQKCNTHNVDMAVTLTAVAASP